MQAVPDGLWFNEIAGRPMRYGQKKGAGLNGIRGGMVERHRHYFPSILAEKPFKTKNKRSVFHGAKSLQVPLFVESTRSKSFPERYPDRAAIPLFF